MKSNYSDLAIDALIAKSMATHLTEIDESQASDLLAAIENLELDILGVMEKLPATFSEVEERRSQRRKAISAPLVLTSFMAMNRENDNDSFDSETEGELNRARETARTKLIKEQERKENLDD